MEVELEGLEETRSGGSRLGGLERRAFLLVSVLGAAVFAAGYQVFMDCRFGLGGERMM